MTTTQRSSGLAFSNGTRINGIVISEPQRFIQPLPDIDPALVRVVDGVGPSPSPSGSD